MKKIPLQFIDLHEDLANYFTKARGLLEMPKRDFAESHPTIRHADMPGYKSVGTRAIVVSTFPFDVQKKDLVLKDPLRRVLADVRIYDRLIQEEDFVPIRKAEDMKMAQQKGKIGLILHMEGSEAVASKKDLDLLFDKGIRSLGLTWRHKNHLAGGDMTRAGLTDKGREMLKAAQEKHMILDLTHLNRRSFDEVLRLWTGPCMVSHTAFKRFYDHPQNMDERQIGSIIKRGGIMGISFLEYFYGGNLSGLETLLEQLDWFKKKYGCRHIAIGSDYFGFEIDRNLDGLKSIYALPMLAFRLKERGWKDGEIQRLFWKNAEEFLIRALPKN
jgi:membrane dipeptidase